MLSLLLQSKETLTAKVLQDLPANFFKSIGDNEFGISRLMADPYNNLHKMLESYSPPQRLKDDFYEYQQSCENSYGDEIKLVYHLRAKNQDEATKLTEEYIQRLKGPQRKVFEACWAIANKKMRRTLTSCSLTELMVEAYPNREKDSFSTSERFNFFIDLLDLSYTKLIVTKKDKNKKTELEFKLKRSKAKQFVLPFITIHTFSAYNFKSEKESERYPNSLSFSVLDNPEYEKEKMYNVGAGIKYSTLELRAEDLQLAEYVQIRKSQLMKEKFITFTERKELMKIARLDGVKHTGSANRALTQKFERLKDKKIIIDYPEKVTFPFHIKIR